MKKNLIDVHSIRSSALIAVLMLSTGMLVTIGIGQNSVFAQSSTSTPTQNNAPITPAPQSSGGDSDDESSGDDSNDDASNSSGSDDDDSDSSSEDEDEFDQTNPLLEQIINKVYGALSSAGIPVP